MESSTVNGIILPNDFTYPNLIRPWACFDTETTGLTKFDDILQLSLIDCNGLAIDEYFNTRPKINHLKSGKTSVTRKRTWKKSMEVHHITPEMVKDKLSLVERKEEFKNLFKQYSIILGYNVKFDIRMIESNMWYYINQNSGVIDVLDLWRKYREKNSIPTPNNKLITASKYFGWDYTEFAHNALADVYATIYVFQKIIEDDDELYMECINAKKLPPKPKYIPKKAYEPDKEDIEINLSSFDEESEDFVNSPAPDDAWDPENPF